MCRCRMIIMGMRRIGEEGGNKELYLGLGENGGEGYSPREVSGIGLGFSAKESSVDRLDGVFQGTIPHASSR